MLNWSRLSLFLALSAGVLLLVAGPGTRQDFWSFSFGFQLLRWSAYLGLAAAVLALAGLCVARVRNGQAGTLVKALILSIGVVSVPFYWFQMARSVPAIHDITTDVSDPPQFVDVVELRRDAPNPHEYDGPEVAEKQRQAYPHILPLQVMADAEQVFDWALASARDMSWDVVAEQRDEGRIEAVDTTFWFRFKDDVVIRITEDEAVSRVDVRSKSRIGRSDLGTNARRISDYLDSLRVRAAEQGVNVEAVTPEG